MGATWRGGHGEDLGHWEDLDTRKMWHIREEGKQKLRGEGGHGERNSAQKGKEEVGGV